MQKQIKQKVKAKKIIEFPKVHFPKYEFVKNKLRKVNRKGKKF